jgi:hypothetical protein
MVLDIKRIPCNPENIIQYSPPQSLYTYRMTQQPLKYEENFTKNVVNFFSGLIKEWVRSRAVMLPCTRVWISGSNPGRGQPSRPSLRGR